MEVKLFIVGLPLAVGIRCKLLLGNEVFWASFSNPVVLLSKEKELKRF